jgi:hypothetical protein
MRAKSAKGRVQIWYAGSAVDQQRHPDGLVLANIRRRGIAGQDSRLAFMEWSAEVVDENGRELLPDQVPDDVAGDPAVWLSCNPAVPLRVSLEHVEWEFRAMDRRSFATEILGVGDWPEEGGGKSGPIGIDEWLSLADPASEISGPICLGFDVGPNRRTAIAVAGHRSDGLLHVEICDHRLTTEALAERIVQLVNERDPWTIAVDAFGVAGDVVRQLEELGVNVHRVTLGEHAEAVGVFVESVTEPDRLRHLGSSELFEAIKGASTRSAGDAHLWSRRNSSVDISPLVAASLAIWGARGMPEGAGDDPVIY